MVLYCSAIKLNGKHSTCAAPATVSKYRLHLDEICQESDKATVRVNRMGRPDSEIYSPDTGQDRWNFADGDLRAPMKCPEPSW